MSLTDIDSVSPFARLWRWTLFVHRWLGVGLGMLVFAWCLSGVVMMYVPYPALEDRERLSLLEPVVIADMTGPINVSRDLQILAVDAVALERWSARNVLRVSLSSGEVVMVDPRTGTELETLSRQALEAHGLRIGEALGAAESRFVKDIRTDQWTVHGHFNRHRPLLLFENSAGTQWYVSSKTGELVQMTGQAERLWNWLGSVVHWLYPTVLRQDTALWSSVVIWLTLLALFLTLTGLMIGIRHYRFSKLRRRSPYTGWSRWHHCVGLVFGVFTLIWLTSGLFSMNPWGALQGRSFALEHARLLGDSVSLGEAVRAMQSGVANGTGEVTRILARRSAFGVQVLVYDADGMVRNLHETRPSLDAFAWAEVARPDVRIESADTLTSGDAYYYSHHGHKVFPVFRAVYEDGERLYFHPLTGALLLSVDVSRAWYRWVFKALHTGDFHRVVRVRPGWDVWMILLLSGVIAATGTGVVLACRRLFSRGAQARPQRWRRS